MKNKIPWLAFTLLLQACATTSTVTAPESTQLGYEEVSLEEVEQNLGLNDQDLGFYSRAFNSCSLPNSARGDDKCGDRHFSVIHFRILCRDTTGTTENTVTSLDLRALTKNLEWIVGPHRGRIQPDADGYGKVRVISTKPIGKNRFVLKSGKAALGLTSEDVSRIVVPDDWCS